LYETFGEDPHLVEKFGEAYIKGHQGTSLKNRNFTATCAKHFIGYSLPLNGRDRSPAYMTEAMLRDIYLPPFQAAIKAGSPTVMINSGHVNNVPGHANKYFMNDILKGELNFQGFTVSDWKDVKRLHERDKVAETPREAVRLAVMSGLDMSMVPNDYSFFEHCVDLAKSGNSAFMNRVNDATKRILRVKDQLGLFDDALLLPNDEDLNKIGTDESEMLNLEFARESVILAKNEKNTLPLELKKTQRILVTGPTANLLRVLNGGWSYVWQGDKEELFQTFGRKKLTLLDALRKKMFDPDYLEYVEGETFEQITDIGDDIAASKFVDYIILCLGEPTYTESLGNINNLMISDLEVQLANALFKSGKPVIIVYLGGRPRVMSELVEKAQAVILGFLPG
jgi:beta-glucosidase